LLWSDPKSSGIGVRTASSETSVTVDRGAEETAMKPTKKPMAESGSACSVCGGDVRFLCLRCRDRVGSGGALRILARPAPRT